jgi:S1-C subfamily serine protease
VYAFGSPFGFKFSMSEGIISGLGRDPRAVIGEDGYTNFIQTDAAVNPGNSGGPLVNVEGRVIGMNVAIATGRESNGAQPEEGQSAGISFAIPLSTIEPVVQRIISGGAAPKGFLGIQYLGIDERNTARLLDLGIRKQGVYIDEVTEEAPAARAGLKPGDVIVAINSRTVTGLPAFRTMVANAGPGEIVDVRVLRKGEELDFKVTLDPMPPSRVELREILEAMASFGITGFGETDDTALVIADVSARSAAAQEGFRVGQTITSVERQRVTQLDQLMVSLYNAGLLLGKPVNVEVLDENGQRREMSIRQIAAP